MRQLNEATRSAQPDALVDELQRRVVIFVIELEVSVWHAQTVLEYLTVLLKVVERAVRHAAEQSEYADSLGLEVHYVDDYKCEDKHDQQNQILKVVWHLVNAVAASTGLHLIQGKHIFVLKLFSSFSNYFSFNCFFLSRCWWFFFFVRIF